MGTLITIAGMFASLFFGFFVLFAALMRASRKGYQSGTIGLVWILGTGAGTVLLLVPTAGLDGRVLTALGPLFVLLPPALVLLMLPRRKPRRIFSVQRVRFPYAAVGQAVFVIGCVATAIVSPLSWWTGGPWWLALVILACGLLFAALFKDLITNMLGQPMRAITSFADMLAIPRPPVVFMRAFDLEGAPFVVSDDSAKYRHYSLTGLSVRPRMVTIPLDEYLKPTIERRIGPFLALGNPQDYFTPAGALRAYFKDETWMEEFRELAKHAACFLVGAGASSNLRWELQYLRQANLHGRLVVIAGHPTQARTSVWAGLASRMAGTRLVSWHDFAGTLKEVGYEVPAGEPEFGTVIGFDSDARAHVLTSDADLPEEFVEPIEAWLENHQEARRCVEVACTKCARMVFKRSDTLAAPFLCPGCRAGSPLIRGAFKILRLTVALLALPVVLGIFLVPTFLGWPGWITYPWAALVFIGWLALAHVYSTAIQRLEDAFARH